MWRIFNWGCPRIAQQIALAFLVPIDKHVVRRILAHHYRICETVRVAKRTTVSGFTYSSGPRQPRQTRDKPTQQSRSKVVRTGRLRFRWNAASCSRRAAFSTATAWWPLSRSRTNRKMDKKMTGMVPIVRLHPTPSQLFKAGPNNGEAQVAGRFSRESLQRMAREQGRAPTQE